jgi:D-lactate dehydrogenase (quinone)
MVEADGVADDVPRQIAALEAALAGDGLLEIQSGFTAAAIAALWVARKSLSHAVKKIAPLKINEDVVVPVARLANLVNAIDALASATRAHRQLRPCRQRQSARQSDGACRRRRRNGPRPRLPRCLIEAVLGLGGSLSGEHGIGSEKRHYVGRELDASTWR